MADWEVFIDDLARGVIEEQSPQRSVSLYFESVHTEFPYILSQFMQTLLRKLEELTWREA